MNRRGKLPKDFWSNLRVTLLGSAAIAAAGALSMLILLAPEHIRRSDVLQYIGFAAGLFFIAFAVLGLLMGPSLTREKAL